MCRVPPVRDWRLSRLCAAWEAFQGAGRPPVSGARHGGRSHRKQVKPQRRAAPPRPAVRTKRTRKGGPVPTPPETPPAAAAPTAEAAAPVPVPVADGRAIGRPRIMRPPVVLLGLVLSLIALGYPLRRRIQALAGPWFSPVSVEVEPRRTTRFSYRPAIDPFSVPLMGLSGAGAPATARVLALAALEDFEDTALVVVPRPDAIALFGLAEDELLEGGPDGLFLPGNLESALGSMETELAVRRDAGGTCTRRFLLVADCEDEIDRIERLVTAHPGEVAAVLLGDWPGERAEVDGEGTVQATATLADRLPERLPALSRTAARDRLYTMVPEPAEPRRRGLGLLKRK
ncbi:hypothetical protein BTM25_23450 [Actinomadura rubteroloni]|uniref:Uncharacterized protein n=2 Tax=Actinomadura rubteroloni TaxID=1926885 RepID=A0A2P4UF78_9ACTN|nr:hypothetical protein BTM25_23450 [Actinomadura rubteroloni]